MKTIASKIKAKNELGPILHERIPFEDVINDPKLMKPAFDKLSGPQKSALKIFYGLKLNETELKHYNMFRGNAKFDELGYVKEVEPATDYLPREHDEAVVVFGRRSAKTSNFLAFILVYEAIFGGHTAFRANAKQQIASFVVAQKLDIAQAIIRDFVEPLISSSPLMAAEIVVDNTEGILLRNGHRIVPAPPIIKNFRYFAIPVVVMDEAAFWYKDAESANPDYEVLRAVEPAQMQFPDRKIAIGSTVWSKEGIIWEAKNAGIYGSKLPDDDERKERYRHTLVLVAPTPAMENPLLQRGWFARQFLKDPEAYKREILNIASDAVSGLFTEQLLLRATDNAPQERQPICEDPPFYVGAIDPAFRGDDFAFTIGHYDREKGYVQDFLRYWTPEKGSKLSPGLILDEIAAINKKYNVDVLYSDQYQLESLQELASDRNMSIIGIDFTASSKAKIFGSFLVLMRNNRVHLLREKKMLGQFATIQKIIGHGGYMRISAPAGKHDDLVLVTVLNAYMAIKFVSDVKAEIKTEPTPYEIIMAKLMAPKNPEDEYL